MRFRSLASLASALGVAGIVLVVPSRRPAQANPWPPPKGTDMSNPANWPNDPSYTTDWNYWSWLPKQLSSARPYVDADKTLGAAGMHIDTAWTHTIGRPDVKIAVIDCGIKWDESDLANKEYLSAAELSGTHRPQDATGTACKALTPAPLGYDCDGDGVFTVKDYIADPRISPMVAAPGCPGSMSVKGDANGNCILDAGDLIQLFSDGVDDDNNGYTDDISGWDFYKNDNNPYDDTRYGHGSGEARDSSAEGNNGQGDIGVCPDCRFMMLRAGDSFIADATDFAKAVVYATDGGAKVVQEALGTIDQTSYSKAAIDYAYAHGTVIIASMADENSRHHNMPGAYNHTLPVHAIRQNSTILEFKNGAVDTNASSFIEFNACSNYGGQNMLSVSGDSCSSEATGKGAGEAGLIYSEAMNQGIDPPLSPEEVMQLLKMNADVIDVPESRSSNPDIAHQFYESLPYFSQRFGYGRPNMENTLQAIDDHKIPPEVDLVSPAWFQTLYADRTPSTVPVIGRIAASRATSYDYTVEWAAGVEPSDADFQPLTSWVRNVQASTVTGGPSTPLATLSPGQMNTTHRPDPDSAKFGENDRTITVRVRAIAHYAGGVDVPGQARRTLAIVNALPTLALDAGAASTSDAATLGGIPNETITHNGLDPDLLEGFPIDMGASVETSPKLADIDGDGVSDIVAAASNGSLHVFSLKTGMPVELPGFPYRTAIIDGLNPSLNQPTVPSYLTAPAYMAGKSGGVDPDVARESVVATPAVGDVNGDGKRDIVVSSWQGSIYVIGADGKALPGWPKRLPLIPSCPQPQNPAMNSTPPCMDPGHKWSRGAGASPVLVDLDGDHHLDILQAAFDGFLYAWHGDGTAVPGWPVAIHATDSEEYNRILSTPAVGDFNGDGVPDVVTGSNEETGGGGAGHYFLVDGRGTNTPGGSPYFPHWPITMTSLHIFPLVAEGTDSAPAIADFTGSGHPEILVQGNGAPAYILPVDPGAQKFPQDPPNRLPVYHTDAGTQIGLDPTSVFGVGTKAFAPDTMFPLFSHPSVGDLDQDGTPDVIMAGGSLSLVGSLEGSSNSGGAAQQLLAMWSGKTGHQMFGSPVPIEDFTFLVNESVADITGDGYPEVILGTGGYFVRAVDACGCEAKKWPKFTGGWLIASPAVGDVDGNHSLEVVTGTRDGYLYAWRTQGSDSGVVQWESFHHDNANTGNYATSLGQGVLKTAAKALDCAVDCSSTPPPPTESGYAAGGCGCRTVTADDERVGGFTLAAALGLVGLVSRRRRRRP